MPNKHNLLTEIAVICLHCMWALHTCLSLVNNRTVLWRVQFKQLICVSVQTSEGTNKWMVYFNGGAD